MELREDKGKSEGRMREERVGKIPASNSFPLRLPSAFPSVFPLSSLEFQKPCRVTEFSRVDSGPETHYNIG
jgi:hypothetical protein